jgi:signal transduction histidine kinase
MTQSKAMSDLEPSGLSAISHATGIDEKVTLLVVDDYHTGRYVKTHLLAKAGFPVLEARTGTEALRLVAEHQPALVVLDVKLPDMDGISVCRAIKSDPATANIMVLQVSAYYTRIEDQVVGLDSGADAYIPGDIAPSLLVASVRALLRTRRAEEVVRVQAERLQLAQALAQSQEELRALAAGLLTAQEEERRRIARELHDDLSQHLVAIEMELTRLRQRPGDWDNQLDRIIGRISGLAHQVETLSHGLHPSIVESFGLKGGLQRLCEEFEGTYSLATRCVISTDDRPIPLPIAIVFYRIAQEALRNVAKHASDARVIVTLLGSAQELCLTIQDDGCGFDPGRHPAQAGLGLISMQERARLVGARVEVHSALGEGTLVRVCVPCSEGS